MGKVISFFLKRHMCKRKIFAAVASAVSEVTEIPETDILSKCRREEVVDARFILVYLCIRQGLYPSQIAECLGQTQHNVHKMMRSADRKLRKSQLRSFTDITADKLGLTL